MSVKITVHYEKARELALLGWEVGKQVLCHGVPHTISYVDTESQYDKENTCLSTYVTYTLKPVSEVVVETQLASLQASIWKKWADRC